jgi:hypothetical protein
MNVNKDSLLQFAANKNWGPVELSRQIGIDYSFLTRILNGKQIGGQKFFSGIFCLCQREGLRVEDFIIFDSTYNSKCD